MSPVKQLSHPLPSRLLPAAHAQPLPEHSPPQKLFCIREIPGHWGRASLVHTQRLTALLTSFPRCFSTAMTEAIIKEATGREDFGNIKELEIIFTHIPEIACLARLHSLRSLTRELPCSCQPPCTRMHLLPLSAVINTGLLSLRGLEPASDTLLRLVITNQPKLTELGDLRLPQLRDCLLHNNGLTSMAGLQHCPQIQRLWLNGNKVQHITHLDNASNLRELWLQQNALTDCWEGLQACSQLEVLGVAGNPIRNLAGLQRLQTLPSLRALSLTDLHFGSCPVASTEGYRHFVVAAVPQLTVVDERPVQAAEREGATKALLGLGDALAQRVRSIHEEYDRADAELDTRLARHAREAAAVVGDAVAQLQALARTAQEGKAMMRADYQGQISAPQRARADYSLALDIFERQVQRWGSAREAASAPALTAAQHAAALASDTAPWLCAVREAVPGLAPPLPPSAPVRRAAVAAAPAPTPRALLPSGLAMDYSALRRAGSPITAASSSWVPACVHCVLPGGKGDDLQEGGGSTLYAPLPPAGVAAAHSCRWSALQKAQTGACSSSAAPCLVFAHPSDAAAWGVAAGWAVGGVLGVAQLHVPLPQDVPVVHSDNGGSALLTLSAATAALATVGGPLALIRLEVGSGGAAAAEAAGTTPHWAAIVSDASDTMAAFSLRCCMALHVDAADVAAVAAAARLCNAWEQQHNQEAPAAAPSSPSTRPVPPPATFLSQASQMLDAAHTAYAAAAAGTGAAPPLSADEAAAEQRRAFARIMGTRRAIDSVRGAQETLLAQMAEGSAAQ